MANASSSSSSILLTAHVPSTLRSDELAAPNAGLELLPSRGRSLPADALVLAHRGIVQVQHVGFDAPSNGGLRVMGTTRGVRTWPRHTATTCKAATPRPPCVPFAIHVGRSNRCRCPDCRRRLRSLRGTAWCLPRTTPACRAVPLSPCEVVTSTAWRVVPPPVTTPDHAAAAAAAAATVTALPTVARPSAPPAGRPPHPARPSGTAREGRAGRGRPWSAAPVQR